MAVDSLASATSALGKVTNGGRQRERERERESDDRVQALVGTAIQLTATVQDDDKR